MRKESKIRLSKLLEKFSLVERVAPELPKIKERLRDVELASCKDRRLVVGGFLRFRFFFVFF